MKTLALWAVLLWAGPALAASSVNRSLFGGVALKGYDPVAYFVQGQPVKGRKEFVFRWSDATWKFSSVEHRDLFARDPAAYAPQFGGYCAWAVSQGYTADIDPASWKIVSGKLYLNYDPEVQARWAQDIPGFIARAEKNWPRLLSK
jgi:hypothetical protein